MSISLLVQMILALLVGGMLISSRIRIAQLKQALRLEKDRNKVPVLTFSIDPAQQLMVLINEGSCTAKDIVIEDLPVTLDYQFKKTVRLSFTPIPALHPTQNTPLAYTIHEGEYNITKEVADSFFGHLLTASFEACLKYANFQNIYFSAILQCTKGHVRIAEIKPVEFS